SFISSETEKRILKKVEELLPQVSAVIVEDYQKGLLSETLLQSVLKLGKNANCPILVDPNPKTPLEWYRGAEILTPNKKEAEGLLHEGIRIRDDETLLKVGERLLEKTEAKHVVVTLGKDGMALFSRESQTATLIPTFAREV